MRRHHLTAGLLLAATACTDAEIGTHPYAHETPPGPPSPVAHVVSSRFLGGSGVDRIDDLVVSGSAIYVAGVTSSPDFPTTTGPTFDATVLAGCSACPAAGFAAALDLDGNLLWSTLLDSPGYDHLTALVMVGDALYVGGSSGERPGLAGWHGGATAERGDQDGIVCALGRADGALQACRYLGGNGPGGVTDLVATSSTALAVTFTTTATEALHVEAGYAAAFAGASRATSDSADGVVVGLSTELAAADNLRWATYVGGSGVEDGSPGLWFDGARLLYLGDTTSTDAPTPGGWITTAPAGRNAYLAALSLDGMALTYGTYLGGDGDDTAGRGGLASVGEDVHVAITTTSSSLPTSPFGSQPSYGGDGPAGCGSGDVWLTVFPASGGGPDLGRTGYLGGATGDRAGALATRFGWLGSEVVVAGRTSSINFPVHGGAQVTFASASCTSTPGTSDGFVTAIGRDARWLGSTYLGGRDGDDATAVAFDEVHGRIVVAGATASASFPIGGSADATFGGAEDGFITVLGELPPPPPWQPDGGSDGGDDGGSGEDGGCCGTSPSPAGALGLSAMLGLVLARRRRHR